MIVESIWRVAAALEAFRANSPDAVIVFTSLPADCMHVGHLRLLKEATKIGHLVVAVNSDRWLERKKGYFFMPLDQRMEMIDDHYPAFTFPYDDIAEAIRILKPDVFAKGGSDRSSPDQLVADEVLACQEVNCRIQFGVGGYDKANSSSQMVRRACQALMRHDLPGLARPEGVLTLASLDTPSRT